MWRGEALILRLTATEAAADAHPRGAARASALSRTRLVEDLGRDSGKDGGQAQERAVDVQITRLRRKIEPDPRQPRYLQTVRGRGLHAGAGLTASSAEARSAPSLCVRGASSATRVRRSWRERLGRGTRLPR